MAGNLQVNRGMATTHSLLLPARPHRTDDSEVSVVAAGSVGSPAWTVNATRLLKRTGLYPLRSPSPSGLGP